MVIVIKLYIKKAFIEEKQSSHSPGKTKGTRAGTGWQIKLTLGAATSPGRDPVQVSASLFLIQLPTSAAWLAVDDGPSAWAPATHQGTWMASWILASAWLLWSLGEQTRGLGESLSFLNCSAIQADENQHLKKLLMNVVSTFT